MMHTLTPMCCNILLNLQFRYLSVPLNRLLKPKSYNSIYPTVYYLVFWQRMLIVQALIQNNTKEKYRCRFTNISAQLVDTFLRFSPPRATKRPRCSAVTAKATKWARFSRPVVSGVVPAQCYRLRRLPVAARNPAFPELPKQLARSEPTTASYFSLADFFGGNSNTRSFLLRRLCSRLAISSR